jgi:uncharacterized membrane protein YfcA
MLVDGARVPIYLATGGEDIGANLRWIVILSAGAMLGTLFGAPILRRLPDAVFRRVLALVLIGLGGLLIAGYGA